MKQGMWRSPAVTLVCGGLILFLCLGQRHSFGLFLRPITMDLLWSRETFSIAIALQNLVWGMAQPFSGMIADKYGAHRVMVAGGALYALGLLLMPFSGSGLSFAVSAGLLIGLGLSGTGFGIVYGAVGRAFPLEKRAHALGVVGALGGLGLFMMLPFNQMLIDQLGWASALIALSAACSLMVPLAFGFTGTSGASRPAASQSVGQAVREAFSHSGFWLLTLGFLACGFQLAFIATHLPAYLADRQLTPEVAVTALAVVALFNVAGSYLGGYLGGRFSKKYLLTGVYLARGLAILLLLALPPSAAVTYLFAAIMGLLWLGTVPLTSGIIGQIFGLQYVSTLFGFVFFSHQLGSFLGVWLGGVLFDRTGSYDVVWMLAIGLSVLSAALHFPIDDKEVMRARAAAAG